MQCALRALLAALVLFGVAACGFEQPVAEADKALFLRVADLAPVGVRYRNSEAHEKFSKTKHLSGVYELSYQFQTLARQLALDEIVVNTWADEPAARRRSYELLAQTCGLPPRAATTRATEREGS